MKISRFDFVSPIDFRYISADEELSHRVREYSNLDIFKKLGRVIPEIVTPRIILLEQSLLSLADENKGKQIPKRIDGRSCELINLEIVFRDYEERLRSRREKLQRSSLDFEVSEGIRNDRVSDLVYNSVCVWSVEANIANDIRHHFRNEIAEFTQMHSLDVSSLIVGSSTMPHKINPKDYEKVVSLWKSYFPFVNTVIMGQIVEHQGDSTNEELPYRAFELLCALSYTTGSLERSLKGLKVCV